MQSLAFKNRNVCPPDGFRYVVPETGFTVHSWTYDAWIAAAIDHLRGNNIPVPDNLEDLMQTQLCQTLEPGWCDYDDPDRKRVSTSLSWDDLMGGIATFTAWIAGGCDYVSQSEADRRALICSRCYMNVNVQGCASCHKAVTEIVRNKKSKYDFALRSCAVCKCFLRAKVHFPLSILDRNNPGVQELYPGFCWLKKDGDNYRG